MSIQFTCPCGQTLQVAEQYAGRDADCPVCGTSNRIPPALAIDHFVTESLPRREPPLPASPPPLPKAEGVPIDETKPITTHAGTPITDDDDFFVAVPAEIGVLISAATTLKKHKEPLSAATRTGIVLASTGGGAFAGIMVAALWTGINAGLALWMLGLGAAGLFIALYATRFSHTCGYVGKDGVARFRCRGSRERLVQDEVFLYQDALELRIAQTRHYYNGAYTGTNYSYTWTNVRKNTVYAITGRHNSEPGTPKPIDAFWFANSAELAWSIYLLNHMEEFADEKGSYYFGLKKNHGVEVGPGYLTLFLGGEPVRLEKRDIAQVQIDKGMFAVRQPDAKEGWFSSHGVYKFPYHDLANAQFFMLLLKKLIGVTATG